MAATSIPLRVTPAKLDGLGEDLHHLDGLGEDLHHLDGLGEDLHHLDGLGEDLHYLDGPARCIMAMKRKYR